jgi:hypothetical protein
MNKVLPAKVSSYVGCKIPIFCVSNGDLADYIQLNNFGLSTFSYDYSKIFDTLNFDFFKYK